MVSLRSLLPLLVTALLGAQTPPAPPLPGVLQNGDFERGAVGQVPEGWMIPKPSVAAGFTAEVSEAGAVLGRRCLDLHRESGTGAFGNAMQRLDATPFQGKRVRFRLHLRAQGELRAQAWMRVDRPEGRPGFFDNMADRGVTETSWVPAELIGDVAPDAKVLNVGIMALGEAGHVWVDACTLEILGPSPVEMPDPPRPLTAKGLENLKAFARAYGYLRFFHPSDPVAAADWNEQARLGALRMEGAATPRALARALQAHFASLAPTVRFLAPGEAARPARVPAGASALVRWRHVGFGAARGNSGGIYSSAREYVDLGGEPPSWADALTPVILDLGRGVKLALPMVCYVDGQRRTLPLPARPSAPNTTLPRPTGEASGSGDRRSTRIGDVVIAWNIFQHFFPYFDVVKVDWQDQLSRALDAAAKDADAKAFLHTLRRMTATLRDGHVNVHGAGADYAVPKVGLTLVGGRPIVAVAEGEGAPPRGSELLTIDGDAVADRLARLRGEISAAGESWMNSQLAGWLLVGAPGTPVRLTFLTPEGRAGEATLIRSTTLWEYVRPDLPAPVRELQPGLWYLDLDRIQDKDFEAVLPKLVTAQGVIFDLRGYPKGSPKFLQHLADQPLESAMWNVPIVTRPDGKGWAWNTTGRWKLEPASPRIGGKVVFLTGGGAISYAESCMGIVEAYHLAEIVGEPTAGTNGNVNPFTLPGGYRISWTGMKVLKHDGSAHHGVGIRPTVPASPTVQGLAAGRDEVLERAVELILRGR